MPSVKLTISKLFKTLFGSKIASISKKLDDFSFFKVCSVRIDSFRQSQTTLNVTRVRERYRMRFLTEISHPVVLLYKW